MASEIEVLGDRTTIVMNDTEAPTDQVMAKLMDAVDEPMKAALAQWTQNTRPKSRRGTIHHRDRFVTPDTVFGKIRMSRDAMSDDVVGGAADTTESLVFSDVSLFCGTDDEDFEEQDVWNQIAADIDLDSRLREIWRQLFSDSQVVIGVWDGVQSYKVRGRNEAGNKRRKRFDNLRVPLGITVLDTLKFTPVGNLWFGQEMLAYIATREEADQFDRVLKIRRAREQRPPFLEPEETEFTDEIVERMIVRRYKPSQDEDRRLRADGVDPTYLYLTNEKAIFRHTLTRPGYQRFADVRMAGGVLELLDIKHQLRAKDRGFLLAGVNYLIVVTKGSDKKEALPEELAALNYQMRTVASLPFIVGDHRLHVEIVTPSFDSTLQRDQWDTIDVRIAARLYQTFVPTGGDTDDPLKLGKIIAEGLESRRKMIRRCLEAKVIKPTVERNAAFTSRPKLLFSPEQISLSFDAAWASFLLDMGDTGDLSRETRLTSFGFNQKDEAARIVREKKLYGDIFPKHTVPFSAPAADPDDKPDPNATPASTRRATRSGGRQGGGTRNGGGSAPGSGQGQPARRPRRTAAEEDEET